MVDQTSPLGVAYRPGSHGNVAAGAGVTLSERQPGSIVEVAAWPGLADRLLTAILDLTGLSLEPTPGAGALGSNCSGFGIGPRRFLIADVEEGLAARLAAGILMETGTVTDLSHGRTVIRVSGQQAGWVLSKLFAVDFAPAGWPVGSGVATQHHDMLVQIQRSGDDSFDLYVFRSLARAFWRSLCHAAAEVGYEVV